MQMPLSPEVEALLGASKNELLSFCRDAGLYEAHRGLSKMQLAELLEGVGDKLPDNPINEWRRKIMQFIKDNQNTTQLECHGNCFLHSDVKVAQCYEILEK